MRPDCKNLLHPFQNDPGTSQGQRVLDDLLTGQAKIDNRSLADLLDFFVQLSRHINYYDQDLQVNDWQPFFEKSLPFVLASIIKYDKNATQAQLETYKARFVLKPSKNGLRLLIRYTYSHIIKKINQWDIQIAGSSIPIETTIDKLIKDKLSGPIRNFIKFSNAASNWYGVTGIRFNDLLSNPVWTLTTTDLYQEDDSFLKEGNTKRKRLIALYNKIFQLIQSFHDVIRLLSVAANQNMDQSLIPLKTELQEKHEPHLAILFAFIKLFQHAQDDLNTFTKKHLDFFYKQILQLKPKAAVPDKIHLVLDIQKQLDAYLFKKGLLFKDGKDNNKAEIYFASEEEIVVNKAQVVDQRTLFINNMPVKSNNPATGTCITKLVGEGVYIAPNATMANGVDKEFKDTPPSRATLGDKWSKYTDPENKFVYPYPNARLGFILASPVLLLNEGKRTINMSLSCQLQEGYCNSLLPAVNKANPCCDNPQDQGVGNIAQKDPNNCPIPFSSLDLINLVSTALGQRYYYISQPAIATLVKIGISRELKQILQDILTIKHLRADQVTGHTDEEVDPGVCYCGWEEKLFDKILPASIFEPLVGQPGLDIITGVIFPRYALNVLFSGQKDWIAPLPEDAANLTISITQDLIDQTKFVLNIEAVIEAEQKAITFYDAEALKEDFNTTLPVAKIELDDKIKIQVPINGCTALDNSCCDKALEGITQEVSLYHFFREVKMVAGSKIDVKVCGVKNLIVQNDENVENINSLVRPFGVRPQVGANFYIGSQEIFSKNWQEMWVNVNWKDKPANLEQHYEFYDYENFEDGSSKITEASFLLTHTVLEKGIWKTQNPAPPPYRRLFNDPAATVAGFCNRPLPLNNDDKDNYHFTRRPIDVPDFINTVYEKRKVEGETLLPLNISSDYGFLRLTLNGVGFQHDRYAFVVARHMFALANQIDPVVIPELRKKAKEAKLIVDQIVLKINSIQTLVQDISLNAANAADLIGPTILFTDLNDLLNDALNALAISDILTATNKVNDIMTSLNGAIIGSINQIITDINNVNGLDDLINANPLFTPFVEVNYPVFGIVRLATELQDRIHFLDANINVNPAIKAGLPKEPYTPAIKEMSVDYTATADINDIDIIHVYPYYGTYKPEIMVQEPMLFPTFCDEGNFFIGLQNLVPGTTLSILFQLSEATADSESEREPISWYYLENNEWKLLRTGFEVLEDDSNGLTSSGIIKFSLPANMTSENSVMPSGLHWIKAAIPCKSKSVAEIIGIHTQAVKASFTNEEANDKLRLNQPLEAGSVAKLKIADASVKTISQPYDSFGGRKPEAEGHFYIRVSELLRHKNRAIQKFDYERIILESFTAIFKAKCVNHTYALDAGSYINDFTIAPGYVLIAVIPDLNQLKAAKSFEPKVPVSLLEQIEISLKKQISPFVRLKIMNPRYEKVNFCVRVKLLNGKDEVYYKDQLAEDMRNFLAPWAIGEYEKLSFGQPVSQSEMIRFIESRDYVDYIIDLKMAHAFDNITQTDIFPITARSILLAGTIDICIDQPGCDSWCICGDLEENNGFQPCCDHPPVPVRPL